MSETQRNLDKLVARLRARPEAMPYDAQTNGHSRPIGAQRSVRDETIIEKCRAAENAAKFSDLFDHGDSSSKGGDDSAADYALLGILKFFTQDPDQLERLMRRSRLARPKWDEGRAGRPWLRYSIDNALTDVGEVYDWSKEASSSRSRPIKKNVADEASALADLSYRGKSGKSTKSTSDEPRA